MMPTTSGHHLVTGKPLQPPTVGRPSGLRLDRYASIVVKVYALGCGITLAGQRCDLTRREGTFELEANGKILVCDPRAARHAYGLVTAIKRNVAAVYLSLQAVDQKELAKVGDGVHIGSPGNTSILVLPQGFGKTTMARQLAQQLGCRGVVDEWAHNTPLLPQALHLTNYLPELEAQS